MKKRILILVLFTLILNVTRVNAFDTSLKIYDYAQVLSSEEEKNLKESVDNYIENYNMDMVLVTVKHHEKSTTKAYSEDFYDYNGFGLNSTNDGVLFVIDFTFGYRDIYMLTTGEAIRMYDDYRIEKILDSVANVSKKDYYYWFETFIKSTTYYASLGIPSSNQNTYIDENGDYIVGRTHDKSINWLIISIVSLIVPSIIVGILISKHKMIKKAINANYYVKNVNITTRSDKFLTTHTTSVRIDSDSGSSGGSRVSRGSSGISHGGGGRRL